MREVDGENFGHPDAHINALWAREAEDRITAYEAGLIEAFDADEVFAIETAPLSEASLAERNKPEAAWAHLQHDDATNLTN